MFQLTVEAMPGNIPVALEHDISELHITDQLHVRDIALPSGVTTAADADTVVAQITVRRTAGGPGGEEGGEGDEDGEAPSASAGSDEPSGEGDGE
jgi:large subunit ribosomal protein L25